MTITVNATHIYKEPVEVVAATHLAKYPNKYDPNVLACNIISKNVTVEKSYTKRIAICKNVLPSFLRKAPSLNVDDIKIEEECSWYKNTRTFLVKSRNLSLNSWLTMEEDSSYKPYTINSQWTQFYQTGTLTINGFGRFGCVLELFAKRFLSNGAARSIKVTECLITEKSLKIYAFWYSQFIIA